MRGDTQLTTESRGYRLCICVSVRSQTRMHGECVSGLHRVHSVYGESVAATWLHNGISQYFCTRTHKQQHTNTLSSPQTSRLAVTKQSTYPVLAVRGKLQQSSSSVKDTYPLTSSSHKSQRRRIEGEREGEGGRNMCRDQLH